MVEINLKVGLNANNVRIPCKDPAINTASELAARIGGSCLDISTIINGKWVSYVPNVPLNNFNVVVGKEYTINVYEETILHLDCQAGIDFKWILIVAVIAIIILYMIGGKK